ncbi:MAG: NnrS family protein [Campylobacteraceae bacterium]|nr:NnrS family protein [Campylobacteraceae bacterium]
MFSNWYTKFSSQPHQPFFASGIIFLVVYMSLLLGIYSNKIFILGSIVDFHVYPMLFIIFTQFFLGFLLVVFPRFLMQAAIVPKVYMRHFFIYLFGATLFFISLFIAPNLQLLSMLILLFAQGLSFYQLLGIQKKSLMKDKNDTQWILITFASGLVAHLLFVISFLAPHLAFSLQQFAINIGFYLYLFALIFTVSQRMIPQFTGFKIENYVINKTKYMMEMVYGLLVLKVVLLLSDNESLNILADLPLFLFFTRELLKWKLSFRNVPAIIWVLYLALLWIPIGFLFSTLISLSQLLGMTSFFFEKVIIHTFALGYFTTMLVGFGTRVVLGHSGRTPTADKIAIVMFIFLQVVIIVRIFASIASNFGFDYIFWINHSALLLILALLAWSIKYLWILIKGT